MPISIKKRTDKSNRCIAGTVTRSGLCKGIGVVRPKDSKVEEIDQEDRASTRVVRPVASAIQKLPKSTRPSQAKMLRDTKNGKDMAVDLCPRAVEALESITGREASPKAA